MSWPELQALSARYRLAVALIFAILAAILLTVVSIIIYEVSGDSKLDLSRPGYEPARKQLQKPNDQIQFSSKGQIDQKVIKDFRALYKKQTDDIHKLGAFNKEVLEDSQLLTTSSPE